MTIHWVPLYHASEKFKMAIICCKNCDTVRGFLYNFNRNTHSNLSYADSVVLEDACNLEMSLTQMNYM